MVDPGQLADDTGSCQCRDVIALAEPVIELITRERKTRAGDDAAGQGDEENEEQLLTFLLTRLRGIEKLCRWAGRVNGIDLELQLRQLIAGTGTRNCSGRRSGSSA